MHHHPVKRTSADKKFNLIRFFFFFFINPHFTFAYTSTGWQPSALSHRYDNIILCTVPRPCTGCSKCKYGKALHTRNARGFSFRVHFEQSVRHERTRIVARYAGVGGMFIYFFSKYLPHKNMLISHRNAIDNNIIITVAIIAHFPTVVGRNLRRARVLQKGSLRVRGGGENGH